MDIKEIDKLVKENKLEEALSEINKLIEKEEKVEYLMKRSVILYRLGKKKEALKDVKRARKIAPKNVKVLKALVDINAAIGDRDSARKVLKELKKIDPTDKVIYDRERALTEIELAIKKSDPDLIKLEEVRKHLKKDEILTAEMIFREIEKRNKDYYEMGCLIYRKKGLLSKVIELGEEAINKGETTDRMKRLLAMSYIDRGEYSRGKEILESIEEVDTGVLLDRSYVRVLMGEWKEAKEILEKIIEKNKSDAQIYIRMGDIVARLEGVEAALKWYEKAIQINPMETEAYERVANAKGILLNNRSEVDSKAFR